MKHNKKEINFQKIYETTDWYGNAHQNRCPSVRLLPLYEKYLGKINVELGCGRGHLVQKLRIKGYVCEGYDQINLGNGMHVADITKELKISGDTVICIDCIEHIEDSDLLGLYLNFKKFKTQIVSIHNGPSIHDGVELHINKKTFKTWRDTLLKQGFKIIEEIKIHKEQILFILSYENKSNYKI